MLSKLPYNYEDCLHKVHYGISKLIHISQVLYSFHSVVQSLDLKSILTTYALKPHKKAIHSASVYDYMNA